MTESSRFWSGRVADGASGDAGPYTMDQLAAVFALLMGDRRGVLDGLAVTESSPAGQSVTVTVGGAIIDGIFYECDEAIVLDISDNTSGNPRIDLAVLECDWSGSNAQTIRLSVVEGTPAASPVEPTLTQNSGVLWQEPLAAVAVADGFTSIAESDITRCRAWARLDYPGKIEPSVLAEASIPEGWLACYGQAVSRTTYLDLYDAIGTTYGSGDGSTTFNLPDLRGRVLAGKDDMGGTAADIVTDSSADTLGGTMGEETHTLTTDEMPSHTHSAASTMDTDGGTPHFVSGNNAQAYTVYTASTGGSSAHNNMQPSMFGNWIIKA